MDKVEMRAHFGGRCGSASRASKDAGAAAACLIFRHICTKHLYYLLYYGGRRGFAPRAYIDVGAV